MGTGIAHAFAVAGSQVILVDVDSDILDKSATSIRSILDAGVKLGKLSGQAAGAAMARLRMQTDLDASARDAELAVETASEKMAIKGSVVERLDALMPPEAVIASNTSALSITELAALTRRPERFVGMHFFNPVHKMKLVEIVRGIQTSDDTVARAETWAKRIGKETIVVNEAPGLTTSRMSALLGNEAMYMLLEGTARAEDIDKALRLGLNHPMGPLELGDLTGWDTRLSVLTYLHQTLGEKFRPCPLIAKIVKAGRLGRKTGIGVYEYRDGQMVPGSGLRNGS